MSGFLVRNIDSLIQTVIESCFMLDETSKHKVIQTFVYKLEEHYGVSRDQLRKSMHKLGLKLEEFCIGCNEHMSTFTGNGNPICEECSIDVDSVG